MKIIFLDEARADIREATLYYKAESKHLSRRFLDEIDFLVSKILLFPRAWQIQSDSTRKATLSRFPYSIVYKEEDNKLITIIAISHHKQHPDRYKNRLNDQ